MTHKELLDRLEATLKARRMASDERLLSTLRDDPAWAQNILNRHERALDLAVGELAVALGARERAGGGTESDRRTAAVDLLRRM